MPLTPEDVRNKRFTPVRLREGYDMGEVDQFLDEVESELDRLTQENNDLRSKLSHTSDAGRVEDAPPELALPTAPSGPDSEPESEPDSTRAPVTSIAQASGAAARLLELATRNADEVVTEAKDEADKIVAEARSSAERVESGARGRAEQVDSETAERRQQLFGSLEKDRKRLAGEVEELRSFEREYRSRLKAYFNDQLAQLDGQESVESPPAVSDGEQQPPTRLRSLLDDDHQAQQPHQP